MENVLLVDQVQSALNSIRPFLQADGGDVEIVEIDHEMTLHIKLLGQCRSCSMSAMTMKAGIEEAVKKAAPAINKVVAVDYIP